MSGVKPTTEQQIANLKKSWQREIDFRHDEREQAQRDLAALRSENERLREALRAIVKFLATNTMLRANAEKESDRLCDDAHGAKERER